MFKLCNHLRSHDLTYKIKSSLVVYCPGAFGKKHSRTPKVRWGTPNTHAPDPTLRIPHPTSYIPTTPHHTFPAPILFGFLFYHLISCILLGWLVGWISFFCLSTVGWLLAAGCCLLYIHVISALLRCNWSSQVLMDDAEVYTRGIMSNSDERKNYEVVKLSVERKKKGALTRRCVNRVFQQVDNVLWKQQTVSILLKMIPLYCKINHYTWLQSFAISGKNLI